MKIIVTKRFLDISLDREVEAGEILEISPERYEEMQINAAALDDIYFKAIDTTHTTDAVAEGPEKKAKGRGKKSSK